ncbi:S8 family serine peptidase [Streptomyces diastatochromogenes]|nr:S8 family serine peptidase [Streptomyces diastatochromogenes]
MSRHGTHVAGVLFGGPGTPVAGLAPRCRGLILPVFRDDGNGRVPQLDLARAIERAVEEGAHVINISGGERAADGLPDPSSTAPCGSARTAASWSCPPPGTTGPTPSRYRPPSPASSPSAPPGPTAGRSTSATGVPPTAPTASSPPGRTWRAPHPAAASPP